MDEKNLKLAEFAGWKQLELGKRNFHLETDGARVANWMPPGTAEWFHSKHNPPDFLNSLDALYKQIVPKLHEMGYSVSLSSVQLQGRGDRVYQAHLFKTYHDEALADSEEPARALAESILRMLEDQE